jgi:hypothetical protein
MPIIVTNDELEKYNALRKMMKVFPAEAEAFKPRKRQWWAEVRKKYAIPADAKVRLGLETGTIIDSHTGVPYEKPPTPRWFVFNASDERLVAVLREFATGLTQEPLEKAEFESEKRDVVLNGSGLIYVKAPLPPKAAAPAATALTAPDVYAAAPAGYIDPVETSTAAFSEIDD